MNREEKGPEWNELETIKNKTENQIELSVRELRVFFVMSYMCCVF